MPTNKVAIVIKNWAASGMVGQDRIARAQHESPSAGPNARLRMPNPLSFSTAIHVCPLSALERTTQDAQATHLISVINPWSLPETPATIRPENHLKLGMNDIAEPQLGLIAPGADHIDSLVAFGRRWNQGGPLVIHCLAGVSRSTAAAFILLCVINPTADEHLVADRLRAASPAASPNRRMIRLADRKLSRKGRMIAAVDWIGDGEPVGENLPFALPTNIVQTGDQ